MRAALAVCLLLLAAVPASARDIYVDNLAGDDHFDGAAPRSSAEFRGPTRTIQRALEYGMPGDRIVLANTGEPYREQVSLMGPRNSGSPLRPFILEGNGAILDGAAPVPDFGWEAVGPDVFRFRPMRKSTHNLFVEGRPVPRMEYDRLAANPPELEPEHWALWQGAVYFRTDGRRTPREYALSYTSLLTGITLYHVEHVAIVGLTVQGFQLDGINVNDVTSRCLISDVTCRGNGRSGIAVVNSGQAMISNSVIGDNQQAQLYLEGQATADVTATELIGNTAPAVVRRGGKQLKVDGQVVVE